MKKNSTFVAVVIVLSIVVGFGIWMFILGNPSNFADPLTKDHPVKDNIPGLMYKGGFLVGLLLSLSLMVVTFVIERFLSLAKAKGKNDLDKFLVSAEKLLNDGNLDGTLDLCNQ